jgi:hypothetical protein
MAKAGDFERAEFSAARKHDFRERWIVLLVSLLALTVSYWIARDILYHRLVYTYAQRMYNSLGSAAIETIGAVSVDGQGDIILHAAEAYTHHRGDRRMFFRAEQLRLSLDGIPLRDDRLRVMRVDLYRPEIFIRRESDSEWNVEWAFLSAPQGPEEIPPTSDLPPEPARLGDSFPRNGVHVHDGTIYVTLVGKSFKEVTWKMTNVHTQIARVDGRLKVRPFRGDFYGGQITGDAEVPRTSPFTVRQLTADIRDADVSRMAEGVSFTTHPMKGRLNAVLALTFDRERTKERPIMSGHCEITQGDLWELPAFSQIIHILTLTAVSEKRIDTAIVDFTVGEGKIRVDKMHFLGYPISLFGDGNCGLTGDWMEIVFVPRLGKSDWNSILPVIGAPIDLLSNIFKGALTPVVLKGSFEHPEISVEPLHFLQPSVKQLIQEKSPQ